MPGFLDKFRRGSADTAEKNLQTATPRASTNDPNGLGHADATAKHRDVEAGDDYEGWVDPYGPAPSVKQWFKWYWHDVLA
jgi:diacylglycerol diphosphate phosphatase / phosphatidate phosphatase